MTAPARHQRHDPPAEMGHEERHCRQEDQLTGGICRREQSDNKPFPCSKPASSDICRQKASNEPGGQPDDHAPQQNELPGLAHRRGQHHAGCGDGKRQRYCAACSKAVHHRRREGAYCAEQQQVDPEGEGDRRPRPTELVFERDDQHARG